MAPPGLVLLHGFTHTGASWERVRSALGERYRARAPDIRGHGAAGAWRPVTLEAVIEDLASLIGPAADDERADVTIAGYSMGGRIALHAALCKELAGHFRGLVLIGASPGLQDPAERSQRRAADEALAEEIERSSVEEFAHRWARTPVLAGLPEDVAAGVHADRLRNSPAGLAAALRGLGTGALPPLWDRLGELTIPTTVIVGERDAKFGAIASRMTAAIPDATVVVVPGAGHAVHLEAAEAVARELSGSAFSP